jgi:putative membrane protein insertion efficiency factor
MSDQPTPSQRPVSARRDPLVTAGLYVYRFLLSPILHTTQRTLIGTTGACRFQPTCSEYAALAVHLHGARRGGWLAVSRFLRCHPFARGGFDPVAGRPVSNAAQVHPDDRRPLGKHRAIYH